MIQAFIKIRLLQIYRSAKALGLFRTVFFICLSGFFAFGMLMQTSKMPDSYYTSGIYLLIIVFIQLKRHDKRFLKINFSNYKLVLLTEYLLLMLPLYICLVYHFQWNALFAVIVLTVLVINIDIKLKKRSINTVFQRMIPSACYEWKAGVRKTLVYIFALWLLGLGTSFFVGSVPVALFVLGILPLSFNERNEPVQMILSFEMDTNRFLLYKIKTQLYLFSTVAIPLIGAFLLFHTDLWYIPIIEYFVFAILYIYVILTKYAFYQPNIKSNSVQLFEAIGAIGAFIPFMFPVLLLLAIRFYFKSRKNLNFYLNDYH